EDGTPAEAYPAPAARGGQAPQPGRGVAYRDWPQLQRQCGDDFATGSVIVSTYLRSYVATATTSIFAADSMSSIIPFCSISWAGGNGRTACHQCIKQQASGTGWNSEPT